MRLDIFNSYKEHAWYGKLYNKLSVGDIKIAETFLNENELLDNIKYDLAVNRLFLDKEKPKNWKIITELLSGCR